MNFLLFILFYFLKTLPVSPTHHPTLYSTSTLHNRQSFLSASLVSCLFACLFNYFKSNRAYRVFFFLWLTSCSMMPWVHPCFHKWQDFILFFFIIIIDFWLHQVLVAHAFSSCGEQSLLSSWGPWAASCRGVPYCGAQALGHAGCGSCSSRVQWLQLTGIIFLLFCVAVGS